MSDAKMEPSIGKKIISKLKAGTTPIDCVEYLNVGNEKWYLAANELFEQIEDEEDSLVRFVRGYYGEGKTHFLGMLRSMAFRRGWAVSYVTAENTPLNKFEKVYAEIIRNITLPSGAPGLPWWPLSSSKGASSLLASFFAKMYIKVNDSDDKSGLSKIGVLSDIKEKVEDFATTSGLDEMFSSAVCNYIEAGMGGNNQRISQLVSWIEGGDTRIPEIGIKKQISKASGRDMMRAISMIVLKTGLNGILVLLDEAERIMDQTATVRKKSYGVIRDLLDNADDQAGMRSAMMYIAATPEMFDSKKGFPEYDPLRDRLASASKLSSSEFIDWRGVIVDLTKTPLPNDALMKLAYKAMSIHAIAHNWNPDEALSEKHIKGILKIVEKHSLQISKPRLLASLMATILEIIQQNPGINIENIIEQSVSDVIKTVSKTKVEQWE